MNVRHRAAPLTTHEHVHIPSSQPALMPTLHNLHPIHHVHRGHMRTKSVRMHVIQAHAQPILSVKPPCNPHRKKPQTITLAIQFLDRALRRTILLQLNLSIPSELLSKACIHTEHGRFIPLVNPAKYLQENEACL